MTLIDTTREVTNGLSHPALNDEKAVLRLELLGRFRVQLVGIYVAPLIGPAWDSGGRCESDYLHHIEMVISGRRQVIFNGEVIELLPGMTYFLPGNTPLVRCWIEPCKVIFAKVRCECLPGIDPLLDWPHRAPTLIGPVNKETCRDWLKPDSTKTFSRLLEIRGLIESWMGRIFPGLESIIENHLLVHAQFAKVLDLVEANLGADLRIETLAKAHGVSRGSFTAAFLRSMGMSPKEHLKRRINQSAIELLINSDMRIKEIAEKLRFSDEFYFSRFFGKINGVSPAKYRHCIRTGQG